MTRLHFALVFYPFHQRTHKEVLDIKSTLEIMGCDASLFFADKNLIKHLSDKQVDFALNLARNDFNSRKNEAVAALCELIEVKMIGPNVFSSSIVNNRHILSKILKYHKIPLPLPSEKSAHYDHSNNYCDIFLLGKKYGMIFTENTSDSKLDIDKLIKMSMKIYKSLHCEDYCQIRFSIHSRTKFFFKSITLQPFLANHDNFARLAQSSGIDYRTFISVIVINAFLNYDTPIPEFFTPTCDLVFEKYPFLQDVITL
jgi:hypothetical protein